MQIYPSQLCTIHETNGIGSNTLLYHAFVIYQNVLKVLLQREVNNQTFAIDRKTNSNWGHDISNGEKKDSLWWVKYVQMYWKRSGSL